MELLLTTNMKIITLSQSMLIFALPASLLTEKRRSGFYKGK